jgi:hypothetical protein
LNIATANYGFFSYLALVLQASLIDEEDLARVAAVTRAAFARWNLPVFRALDAWRAARGAAWQRLTRLGRARNARPKDGTLGFLARLTWASVIVLTYLAASLDDAVDNFWPGGPHVEAASSLSRALAPLRLVNTYHLFGQITRERVEPTFETFDRGEWTEHDLHFKPGPVDRAPPFVAPHQPRVDFLLWFYGLGYAGRVPGYVASLLERMCTDPGAVAPLFVDPLPPSPRAARVAFYTYHFASPEEHARRGVWWNREPVGTPRTMECGR